MLGKRISFPQKTVREKKQEYIKREMDIGRKGEEGGKRSLLCGRTSSFRCRILLHVAEPGREGRKGGGRFFSE